MISSCFTNIILSGCNSRGEEIIQLSVYDEGNECRLTLHPQKAHTATAGSSMQCVHHKSSSSIAPIGIVIATASPSEVLLPTASTFLYTGLMDPSASSKLSYLFKTTGQ